MDVKTFLISFADALSANGLTFGFTLALLAIWLLALPFHVLRATERSILFAHTAPWMLLAVGALGSVSGTFATLQVLHAAALDASLPSLVQGLRSAAATGLLSLLLAAVLKIYLTLVPPLANVVALGGVVRPLPRPRRTTNRRPPTTHGAAADPLAALESLVISELQKLGTTLENQIEETRCESQQALAELGARLNALGSQVHDTATRALAQPEPQDDAEESQPARRFQLRIDVSYESGGQAGSGTLVDLSSSGALIEDVDRPLCAGAYVEICYRLEGEDKPTLLHGRVVRKTDDGFGVEFVEPRG